MNHPGSDEILLYLKGEQPARDRRRIVAHLRACDPCRDRVEAESAFDQLLRHRLSSRRAPVELIERIRDGVERVARRQRRHGRRRAWVSCCSAAAALVVAFGLLAGPGRSGHLAQGLLAAGPMAGLVHDVQGVLVCATCARAGVDGDVQHRCLGGPREGHVTGLADNDGRVWSLVEDEQTAPLLDDPARRGQRIQVTARTYPNIDYLRVYAVRSL